MTDTRTLEPGARRNKLLVMRLAPWEKAALARAAREAGANVSTFVRAIALAEAAARLNREPKSPAEHS